LAGLAKWILFRGQHRGNHWIFATRSSNRSSARSVFPMREQVALVFGFATNGAGYTEIILDMEFHD
jgi:hypothetical protein